MNVHETPVVLLAQALATKAHAGQTVNERDQVDDVLRPVAESLAPFGPAAVATGWLRHTLVTETGHTPQTLVSAGVPRYVVDAVVALSRGGAGQAQNPLARIVALADNLYASHDPVFNGALIPAARTALLARRSVLLDGIDENPLDIAAMVAHLSARAGASA